MRCILREIGKDDFGLEGETEVVRPKADSKKLDGSDLVTPN